MPSGKRTWPSRTPSKPVWVRCGARIPRYIPSARKGIWPRARYALKTSVLAQGRDGRLRPAWARYAGNTLNNVIENSWLPPSQTTATQTALRSGMGIVTRMGGNLWDEFWPDVVRLLRKR